MQLREAKLLLIARGAATAHRNARCGVLKGQLDEPARFQNLDVAHVIDIHPKSCDARAKSPRMPDAAQAQKSNRSTE